MSQEEIRAKHDELKLRAKQLERDKKVLKADREHLQAICEHPNLKSFKSGDYSGATYICRQCPDCGLDEER